MSNKLSNRFSKKKDIESANKFEQIEIPELKNTIEKKDFFNLSDNIKNDYTKSLEEKILSIPVWFEYSKEQQEELIKSFVSNKIKEDSLLIPEDNKNELIDSLINAFTLFGAVQYLIDNDKVESVMINGTKSVYISINNQILNTETNLSNSQLKYIVNTLKQPKKIKEISSILKFTTDKYLITVIPENITNSEIQIKIDKIREYNKEYFINNKILTDNIFDFIVSLVNLKKNIVISGAANTYKTGFLEIILFELQTKRVYLIEESSQIKTDFNTLCKFKANFKDFYFNDLLSEIHQQKPEYLVSDLNEIKENLLQKNGSILTLRASTAENALKSIVATYMNIGLPEKFARSRAFEEIDYIIHLEEIEAGKAVLSKILELTPDKTIQNSVKAVVKFSNGKYITDFSQTRTRLHAQK